MYLKRLTLRGFKSFASTTTLNFEPGITCVVGPNGSGKSNVVDALSWVMGEQGAKSLRGSKMEDVIFAGTSGRAPLGRAEVVLTIDNADGALPVDYTEVSISRTMFRNGGSEYAVNGSPARLLDVQELLSDSGIGREMHVIVGQGQLDTILGATPETRRGFIEEAAGILKHRKRKEKAARKLEATRENLDRLNDLLSEIRRQLKPLGRQAEVARRAAVIQADLRDARSRLLADDLAKATAALEADLADEAAMRAARARAELRVEQTRAEERMAEEAALLAAREVQTSQELWYELAALRERVSTILSISAERMRNQQGIPQLETPGRDPESLEVEAQQVRDRENELRAEVELAQNRLTDATRIRTQTEARHAEAEKAFIRAQSALADRREGLARLNGQVDSLRSRLEASAEEVGRLEARRLGAVARAEQATASIREHQTTLTRMSASESGLDEAHEAAEALVSQLTDRVEALHRLQTRMNQDQAALAARLGALRLGLERRDASASIISTGRTGVLGRLSTAVTVESGWETALSTALGQTSEAIVVSDGSTAAEIILELRDLEGGRVHLVLADTTPPDTPLPEIDPGQYLIELVSCEPALRKLLTRLLHATVAVEDLGQAMELLAKHPELSVVTRDGTWFTTMTVSGGSSEKQSMIEIQAAVDEAETDLAETMDRLAEVETREQALSSELASAGVRATEALAALHASDAELAALTDQLGQCQQRVHSAEFEERQLAEAVASAQKNRERDLDSLTELQARLELVSSGAELVEPDPGERDELGVAARVERQKEMEAGLALRTAEERARALAGRADALVRSAANERVARTRARARAERARAEAETARAVNEATQVVAEEVDRTRQRATAERDKALSNRDLADTNLSLAREQSRAATTELEEMVKGAHKDEMARIEQRLRLEQLKERSLGELGMDPDILVAEYGPDRPVPSSAEGEAVPYLREEQVSRLARAERDLKVLGKVNPLALEEFDALSARHSFLAEQLEDLKSTRKDLLDIITEMDNKVEQVFAQAYRDVEQAFDTVFARLFPGGEGRLVLTEPGDWLNTGVEVEARPAGKQVKKLSLLSGGERSLVAVAFLVSLFIARPSPFYILDEVEAALDDVNLSRLLGIYAELRESSQLLIITHQKRTMEIADALYGVTMKGDGISTVISQRFEQ